MLIMPLFAYAYEEVSICHSRARKVGLSRNTHHWLNVGMRHRIKLRILQLVITLDVDERALVLRRIAVLGRREHRDALPVVLDLVALHSHLVTSDDSFKTVLLTESLRHVGAELQSHTTF